MLPYHRDYDEFCLERRREDCMPSFSPVESLWEEPPHWFYDGSMLFRRMALSQVDQTELAESDPLLFHELQGICTLCRSKERCIADLSQPNHDHSDGWSEYCPNANALATLAVEQNCGLAAQYGAGHERVVVTKLGSVILRTPRRANKKIYLERRPEDSPFGPRQYFYAASKSGVVPANAHDLRQG
jgi:hypothetical protein